MKSLEIIDIICRDGAFREVGIDAGGTANRLNTDLDMTRFSSIRELSIDEVALVPCKSLGTEPLQGLLTPHCFLLHPRESPGCQ